MSGPNDALSRAVHLRERLASHAAGHLDGEREAVELGSLADELVKMLQAASRADAPQPFRLVRPTEYRVVTQHFGARPEYYARFNLPGHEGVDLRAKTGSQVYACAEGRVTMAGWHPKRGTAHPYGCQVRILHQCVGGGYETIYAHLKEGTLQVAEGASVKAGQVIALADATGNVQAGAAHLHLTLRQIGAKK